MGERIDRLYRKLVLNMIEGKVSRKNRSNNPFLTTQSGFFNWFEVFSGTKVRRIMNIRFEEDAENFVQKMLRFKYQASF